ncbi:phage baseplate protein [Acinetobacter rathckeae]|uniref:phage baseplate protein n=1 Tax=Acinetobacter rathckeae TaxID=2605272 RepID=UPI0018A3097D|nr:hypothetical protein [Acinetobacter rathckeae]MBF7687086.1 hypothetical protein [Acinetobacter rathckeae]
MGIESLLSSAYSTASSSPYTEKAASLLLAGKGRTIMGLFADVTIEEKHKDEMQITEHPVETGSPISDHAYKIPPELSIKVGWSESAGRLNGLVGDSLLSGDIGLVAVYEILQTLQDKAVRLIVSTGKRLYTNMLIKSLECTTDPETENVLMIDITFKKVNIVKTTETTVLLEQQAEPEKTAQVQDNGTVQKQETSESWLSQMMGGAKGGAYTLLNPFGN